MYSWHADLALGNKNEHVNEYIYKYFNINIFNYCQL